MSHLLQQLPLMFPKLRIASLAIVRGHTTQDKLESDIREIRDKIDSLEKFGNSGLATEANVKQLKTLKEQLAEKQKLLKEKVDDAKRQKKQRKRK